jgi:hypothetical protein
MGFGQVHGKWMPVHLDSSGNLQLVDVWDLPAGSSTYPGLRIHVISENGPRDLVTNVHSPFGSETTILYGTSIAAPCSTGDARLPLGSVFRIVNELVINDGRGGSSYEDYSYECPWWSLSERKFAGWRKKTVSQREVANRPQVQTQTDYLLSDACLSQVQKTRSMNSAGSIFSLTEHVLRPGGTSFPVRRFRRLHL